MRLRIGFYLGLQLPNYSYTGFKYPPLVRYTVLCYGPVPDIFPLSPAPMPYDKKTGCILYMYKIAVFQISAQLLNILKCFFAGYKFYLCLFKNLFKRPFKMDRFGATTLCKLKLALF